MNYCPECGTEVDEEVRFCRECGRALSEGDRGERRTAARGAAGGDVEREGFNAAVNRRLKPLLFERNLLDDVEEWNNLWLLRLSGLGSLAATFLLWAALPFSELSPFVLLPFIAVSLGFVIVVGLEVGATLDILLYEAG